MYKSKGIYCRELKKRDGERRGILTFGALKEDGYITKLNWKEYFNLDVPETTSENRKEEFIKILSKQLRNFGEQIEYNRFNQDTKPDFKSKLEWLLDYGCKLTKAGLKH